MISKGKLHLNYIIKDVKVMNNITSNALRNDILLSEYDVLIADSKKINRESYRPYFPDITKCENGHLIIVYYWNSVHVGESKGIINMKRSTNNGLTWIDETTIIDNRCRDLDSRDPHISMLQNGELILSFFTYESESKRDVFISKSSDNGYTWSEPILVVKDAATSSRIVQVGDHQLLLPIYKPNSNSGSNVFIVRSTDYDETWDEPKLVDTVEGSESSIVYGSDNTVYLLMRPHGNLYKSSDNGYSFHKVLCAGSMHAPHFLKLKDNLFLATWCRPESLDGNRAVEGKIFYTDSGWNATKTKLIYCPTQKNIWDMGYQSSIITSDGRILTVYYDSCNEFIAGTYSDVGDWGFPV